MVLPLHTVSKISMATEMDTAIFHDEGAITYIHNIQAAQGRHSAVIKKKNVLSLSSISSYFTQCHGH